MSRGQRSGLWPRQRFPHRDPRSVTLLHPFPACLSEGVSADACSTIRDRASSAGSEGCSCSCARRQLKASARSLVQASLQQRAHLLMPASMLLPTDSVRSAVEGFRLLFLTYDGLADLANGFALLSRRTCDAANKTGDLRCFPFKASHES